MEKQSYLYKNPNHSVNLNNMRLSGKLCDVTIKVGNKKLRAHKVILAANLKYFESMFLSSFKESKQNIVNMEGIDGNHLEAFISFVYTGEILITDSNVFNLFSAANYLSEDGIVEACIEFLRRNKLQGGTACVAYKLVNTIAHQPLKDITRQWILSDFKECSQSKEFLDFDRENLKDLLSNASSDLAVTQDLFFESIMRWIVHDVESRRCYISELLSCIDITKLAKDYLLEYFCQSIENQDYVTITKDVMSFYRKKSESVKCQKKSLKKHLLMVGGIDKKLYFQTYDFTEKKWCDPKEIVGSNAFPDGYVWSCGAMLDNKFYYVIHHKKNTDLYAFNLVTKETKMLASESRLLCYTAICACTKYVYFCGGLKSKEESNQVMRYDPSTNSFEILPPMRSKKESATAIFYQDCLYVLGGTGDSSSSTVQSQYTVEKYNPVTKEWTELTSMHKAHNKCSAAILDGKLYACGGWRCNNIEVYDPLKNQWKLVSSMNRQRFNFLLIAYEGKLLAAGGGENTKVEVYDPVKNEWKIDNELSLGLKISRGTGVLFTVSCGNDDD